MKRFRRREAAFAAAALLTFALPSLRAARAAPAPLSGPTKKASDRPFTPIQAGQTTRTFHPKDHRNWRGAADHGLHCTIWYPAPFPPPGTTKLIETEQYADSDEKHFLAGTAALEAPLAPVSPTLRRMPLIVLSHGSGGTAAQMAWLGTAFARSGFVAVAVDHPGNNASGELTPAGFALWWERTTDLSDLIDGMLGDPEFSPRLDSTRIGAAGFSLGGWNVLQLAGAQADIHRFTDLCRDQPATPVCQIPEAHGLGSVDEVLATVRQSSGESLARSADSFRDPRVKAVFALAPALVETLTPESLRRINIPVALVAGSADMIAPPADNANLLGHAIRGSQETVLPHASHYTFLATCTDSGRRDVHPYCDDPAGVNRGAVHAQVDEIAVSFFDRALNVR